MHYAISAVGVDRPGIVAAVTRVLYEQRANIEDSRMALLGGHFAMMLIVALPEDADPGALEQGLAPLAGDEFGLLMAIRPVAEAPGAHGDGEPYVLSVYGADRPGIVAEVTGALAARGVNITDLATQIVEGPTPVYVMLIECTLPAGADPDALRADLERIAADLGVDLSLHPAEADTL